MLCSLRTGSTCQNLFCKALLPTPYSGKRNGRILCFPIPFPEYFWRVPRGFRVSSSRLDFSGVWQMSPSLVARLNTMFNALRFSNSIGGILNTGTFLTPMRVATKWPLVPREDFAVGVGVNRSDKAELAE